MQPSPVGTLVDDLDTPALLLDGEALDHNAHMMSRRIAEAGKAWRPHAKAFKSPAVAHHLIRKHGALGVTVAKVSEAEVMAAGGVADILIAHLVVGPRRAARLAALQHQASVKATVDHPDHLEPLAAAAGQAGTTIGLLVDLDLGMGRTGVATIDQALELARRVHQTRGLRLEGLMGYEGHTLLIAEPEAKRAAIQQAIGLLRAGRDAFRHAGLPCPIVSAGGTGSYQYTADEDGPTELQAGGGIFACRYYTEACHVRGHQPALTVLASVVSRPAPDRVILDAGRKALSDYRVDPILRDHPDAEVVGLSAEHATVRVSPDSTLQIGSKVELIPGYSDFTFVLHDRVLVHRGRQVVASWPLLGRGMLQ